MCLRYCNPAAVARTPSAEIPPSAPLRGSTALRSAQNDTADRAEQGLHCLPQRGRGTVLPQAKWWMRRSLTDKLQFSRKSPCHSAAFLLNQEGTKEKLQKKMPQFHGTPSHTLPNLFKKRFGSKNFKKRVRLSRRARQVDAKNRLYKLNKKEAFCPNRAKSLRNSSFFILNS